MNNGKTIFLDIDGTVFYHKHDLYKMITETPEIISGTINKLLEWHEKGYYIVITTSRPKGTQKNLEKQLENNGVFYDNLIMGLPTGPRVVINDEKYDKSNSAESICLQRNLGIKDIKI